MSKILIVEDELAIAELEKDYLELSGFSVDIESSGDEGAKRAIAEDYDLIILDLMLPNMDGFEICKKIREEKNIPVIMVSAKKDDIDKIRGLGIGADDYVTKPFSPIELVARVKAQIRRYEKLTCNSSTMNTNQIIVGDLVLNKASYTATAKGEELTLTTKEFDILYYLASSPNQVFSKDQIYEAVWGYNECSDDNSVTVYVNRIRYKLDVYSLDYIKTVWGAGYKFIAQ